MIINLTQHAPTATQVDAGVTAPVPETIPLLNFAAAPTQVEVHERARQLAGIAQRMGAESAMIGGAPYLMGPLELELRDVGIMPLYSFSERRSVETVLSDGTVKKSAVFEHVGWVTGATIA